MSSVIPAKELYEKPAVERLKQPDSWAESPWFRTPSFGKALFHPVVDVLFICGAFSLPFLLIMSSESLAVSLDAGDKVTLFIFFNYAHFASSTVRFYTKPGAVTSHRFLAYGFPAVMLLVAVCAVGLPQLVGRHLMALALTWSPYHYAAQGYGLALLYTRLSGTSCSARDKRWLWWICMLPFFRAFINPDDNSMGEMMGVEGVFWLLPESFTAEGTVLASGLRTLVAGLTPLVFILPVAYACLGRARLPLIALVLVLVNALWLTTFSFFDAVVWATVAHSVQYLFVVTYVHAKDQANARPSRDTQPARMGRFYFQSLLVGVFLFMLVPILIQQVAFLFGQRWDAWQCYLMVASAINLHHFIVDGYIWRSPKAKTSAAPAPAPA